MIKNIKLFVNGRTNSIEYAKLVKQKLKNNDFNVVENDYDLGVAIGGDGTFINMIRKNNFDSDIYYVGINTGHLGFLQEVKIDEVDKLIEEIKENKYKVCKVGIQETIVNHRKGEDKFYSLNEIVVRDIDLKILKSDVYINDDFLEEYTGDGLMIATSTGSTAYNLSCGGSIVPPEFSTLQITPIAPINSRVYESIRNSIIIPEKTIVKIVPKNKKVQLFIDGNRKYFRGVDSIDTSIEDKKIKCLRFSHYNFPQKINEKLLK